MSVFFHVSSTANRESIRAHGLDWTRMGTTCGIAGSATPEEDGVFLCPDEFTAEFFLAMNNTGGPVDMWQVDGVDASKLLDNGTGYEYLPERIPPERISLLRKDIAPRPLESWY